MPRSELSNVQRRMMDIWPSWLRRRNWDQWDELSLNDQVIFIDRYRQKYGERPIDPAIRPFHTILERWLWLTGRHLSGDFGPPAQARTRRAIGDARRARLQAWLERRLGKKYCTVCGNIEGAGCDCQTCECGERVPRGVICRFCHHCQTHYVRDETRRGCCECEICSRCADLMENCTCSTRYLIRTERSQVKFFGDPTPLYPRYAGVEIEFGFEREANAQKANAAIKKWHASMHDDGSIRNFSETAECSTSPARGEAIVEQVTEICNGLNLLPGAGVNSSCGLHVHVQAKDLTGAQLLTMIRLYSKVETALYSVVAPSRRRGTYSQPWGPTFEYFNVLDRKSGVKVRSDYLDVMLYGSKAEAEKIKSRPRKHDCRYKGLNLNALLLYGTLEFRLHQGSLNPQKILNWVAVCEALVEYAATHTERDVDNLIGDAFAVLCKVVRHKQIVRWLNVRREYFAKLNLAEKNLGPLPKHLDDHEPSEGLNSGERERSRECPDCGCLNGDQDDECSGCSCHE